MLKSKYSPAQLGIALAKTLKHQRAQLEKPVYPAKKVEWIKNTCNSMINLLETELNKFNKENEDEELGFQDVISVAQTTLNRLLKALNIVKKKD